jgi:hypothetical protein
MLGGRSPEPDPPSSALLLSLQRTSGNRAVAALLARKTATRTFEQAVAARRWDEAVAAAEPLSVEEVTTKLEALAYEQLAALQDHAGDAVLTWAAIEIVRLRKLDPLYEAAVTGEAWDRAVVLLDGYRETDLLPKARRIPKAKLPAAQAAAKTALPDDNHRVRRALAFVAVEPLTGAAVRPVEGTHVTGTRWEPAKAVPETGGRVSYGSGGQVDGDLDYYGLRYEGADAQQTGWIQFIARNLEKFDAADASLGFHPGAWSGSGQNVRTLSTADAPIWHLDTLSDQAPFYEAASKAPGGRRGESDITPTRTAMFDAPTGVSTIVAPLFADPHVKTVRSRVMFDTYLVKEMQVLRHETVTVEFLFDAAQARRGDPPAKNRHTGGGAVDRLPADRYRAITARFPTFSYLPHE